jgi:glyoxylase-like metal-dependent hydrolase (beta-lactamase superfamily II)
MWLVPLFGHTRGHCGVAVRTASGWLFHVGDAAPVDLIEDVPRWFARFVLGPHTPRLRQFRAAHPQVRLTTGHMMLDFFAR